MADYLLDVSCEKGLLERIEAILISVKFGLIISFI